MRDEQFRLSPGDSNVEQAPFLFEFRRIVERLREWEQAVFEPSEKDYWIFQSLGVVQRHQGDRFCRRVHRIGSRHQHRSLEEVI